MKLRLADGLSLPPDEAITQKYGFIGRSGSGKSYGAMIEKIDLEPGRTVAIPKDSWWVDAPRRGFTHFAELESVRMRQSKEHFRIGIRILQ